MVQVVEQLRGLLPVVPCCPRVAAGLPGLAEADQGVRPVVALADVRVGVERMLVERDGLAVAAGLMVAVSEAVERGGLAEAVPGSAVQLQGPLAVAERSLIVAEQRIVQPAAGSARPKAPPRLRPRAGSCCTREPRFPPTWSPTAVPGATSWNAGRRWPGYPSWARHHPTVRPLGTGVLTRRRTHLGNQLDHGVHPPGTCRLGPPMINTQRECAACRGAGLARSPIPAVTLCLRSRRARGRGSRRPCGGTGWRAGCAPAATSGPGRRALAVG